ncbi:hypothetical protein KCU91_g8266, partial [Aureobasidium melanogenum]
MPPKGSKRTQAATPTPESNKKPRLDFQEQIKRASALAAQLRDGVKDGPDSKNSAANQLASEELMRIFESLEEKTNDTSKSVEDLITAQVTCEVKLKLANLLRKSETRDGSRDGNLSYELKKYLFHPVQKETIAVRIIKAAQKKMEDVSSGNIAAEAKKAAESAIAEEFQQGIATSNSSCDSNISSYAFKLDPLQLSYIHSLPPTPIFWLNRSTTHIPPPQIILTVINKMSKPAQNDTPTKSSFTETNKQPRLHLHGQIQHDITLATRLRQAASKEHLDSKEWTANQATVDKLLRVLDDMFEKALDTSESIEGLVTT